MENIYVWSFDKNLCDWVLNITEDYKGTYEEYNYFRVIIDGTKNFYYNSDDHFNHRNDKYQLNKNIHVWTKCEDGDWNNKQTDLNLGTRDEDDLYIYNNGKNRQYYYSYFDFLDHQRNNNTFYKK